MVSTVAEKPQYTFLNGYITEQSPVNVAEGSALDMENFEIDVTGGLRRRRAITTEAGGNPVSLSLVDRVGDEVYNRYVWRNAGGVSGRVVQVIQLGNYISFLNDGDTLGAVEPFATLDLAAFATPSTTAAQLRTTFASFADGRSQLFVTTTNTEPLYISLTDNDITIVTYAMRIRDFQGIADGVPYTTQPAELSVSHRYNLFNRGWTQTEIDDYYDDIAKYPAKNMTSVLGYRRQTAAGTQEGFGTKIWDSAKMEAEIFGDASAPQGALLLNPFDTTTGIGDVDPGSGTSSNIPIDTWTFVEGPTTIVTIVTTEAHGLSDGDTVVIDNNIYRYNFLAFEITRSLDGTYEAEVVDTTTLKITVPSSLFAGFVSFSDQYASRGTVGVSIASGGGSIISSSGGYITDRRPAVVAWYAGRLWYFGTPHDRLQDTVMFTQIIEQANQYGLCYQANDPTSEIFNALTPADGGTIRIAGLHDVKGAMVLGSSLVVFAGGGIWEIRGGGQSGFTADNYLVRKVSDAECTSMVGHAKTDKALCVATKRGMFVIGYDPNSGLINAQNATVAKINTYWNMIPETKLATTRLDYDDAKKRLYMLISMVSSHTIAKSYTPASNHYTEGLVLDFRLGESGAYYKFSLPTQLSGTLAGYIGGINILEGADNSSSNRKVKYVWIGEHASTLRTALFCDTQNDGYVDISGEEHIPFFKAAHDNTGDWHKRKRASQYVYMFMGRTETGYLTDEDTGEVTLQNAGSVYMQGRWDWSDHSNSGKYTNPVQVYRPRGQYAPWVTGEEGAQDGQPVIVTRNKLRGSGRALALYLYGEAGKDAHIHGWLIQYGVN